jgi:hypothetical protein
MKPFLETRGVKSDSIMVMPCAVDQVAFSFDLEKRKAVRANLNISADCVTGIYVGKFGGLYYDAEAFRIFQYAFDFFPKFKLIILTPDSVEETKKKLFKGGIEARDCHVLSVRHEEVAAYLAAADFAFALVKPSPAKKFSSPIKIGEYWAMGLPVLIAKEIGDDSAIIELNRVGATFEMSDLKPAFDSINEILQGDKMIVRKTIMGLAVGHRNFLINERIYRKIINELATK